MKAINSLVLAAALSAVGLAATLDVQAATGGHGGGGGARGVSTGGHGGGNWSGGGHGGGHYGGGHYGGGHYYGHSHGYYPYGGFYWGAPLLWSAYYWGYPYGYGYGYPYAAAAYPYAAGAYPQQPYVEQGYPEGTMGGAPTTQVNPNAAGAPSQGPAYLNFCESVNAYYPKVTSCPEGWKFQPAR